MRWKTITLGDAIRIKHGFAFKGQYFIDHGQYIVLTPGNFFEEGGFRLRPGKDRFYGGDIPKDYILDEGDLIVAMTEQGPGLLGSSALVPQGSRYLHNQRIGLIQDIDTMILDKRYLYYLFNTRLVRAQISGSATGTKVRHTAPGRIYNVKVIVPSNVGEQHRIASILSAYDDLIENNRRRIQLLEQAAQMLYKEWFVRFRFPGHENVTITDGVPEGWEKGCVADFYDTTSGGTPSRKRPEFFMGEINWVKTQELNEGFIFETEERITTEALRSSSAKLFPADTILVSIYGGTNIGRTGVLASPSSSNQACVALFPRHSVANFMYAQLFFQSIRQSLLGLAQGSAQTNISQQTIRNFPMLFPSKTVMQNFLGVITPTYTLRKNLELQNRRLAQARDLLLPRLMNREVVV